jgi:hypothetical protein
LRKLIYIVFVVGVAVQSVGLVLIFVFPPATAAISPLVCPADSTLILARTVAHVRGNGEFKCVNPDGERIDADASVAFFRFLCLGVEIPYIVLLGTLIAIYLFSKKAREINVIP